MHTLLFTKTRAASPRIQSPTVKFSKVSSILMYVYILYTHAHVYTHRHMYMYARTYIHDCMHACMHAYIHSCIHTYKGRGKKKERQKERIHIFTPTCTHTHTHTHAQKHTHMEWVPATGQLFFAGKDTLLVHLFIYMHTQVQIRLKAHLSIWCP